MSQLMPIEIPVYYEVHDNVVTVVFTRTLPVNSFLNVQVHGSGMRPSTGDSKTWFKNFVCGRRSGGAILGTVQDIFTPFGDAGASTWDLSVAANGNNIDIRVAGQSGADTFFYLKICALVIQG
jgi:hypothetical protein